MDVAVEIAGRAIETTDVLRIDPSRIEVLVPPGPPGTVSITVSTAEGTVALPDGYAYDAFALDPARGGTAGGTLLTVHAASDTFDQEVEVLLGGTTCTNVEVMGPTEVACETPPHAAGDVDVTVATGDVRTTLERAFRYESGFRRGGGLGGGPIRNSVTVRLLGPRGPIEGALVQIPGGEHRGRTDATGTVVLTGHDLEGRQTVVASHECHPNVGVVGFDASFVTLEMPIVRLTPACPPASSQPPGFPSPPSIEGEVVFVEGLEFLEPTFQWEGIPEPGPGERRVAHVAAVGARGGGDGLTARVLGHAVVTADGARGERGYRFTLSNLSATASSAANVVAVAGIESETAFTPNLVGISSPFRLEPGRPASGIEVPMRNTVREGRQVEALLRAEPSPVWIGGPLPAVESGGLSRWALTSRLTRPGTYAGVDPLTALVDSHRAVVAPLGEPQRVRMRPEGPDFGGAVEELAVIGMPDLRDVVESEAAWVDAGEWVRQPHTRTVVSEPLSEASVRVEHFLPLPTFTAPAADDPLPADRTIRWEPFGGGASYLTVSVQRDLGTTEGETATGNPWFFYVHPSVGAVPLPDLRGESQVLPQSPGRHQVEVHVYRVVGLEFDSLAFAALEHARVLRSSLNRTVFTVPAVDASTPEDSP